MKQLYQVIHILCPTKALSYALFIFHDFLLDGMMQCQKHSING